MNRNLTNTNGVAILCLPYNSKVEFCSSFRQGDNTPIIKSVFLCPPFLDALKFEVINSILMELFGQPLRLVSPCRDTANSNNFVANVLQHYAAVILLLDKVSLMTKSNDAPIEQTQSI